MLKTGGEGQTLAASFNQGKMSFGNCHIIARPVLSPEAARQNGEVLSGADVMYGQPDDLHYELEPMNDIEDETETGAECLTRIPLT